MKQEMSPVIRADIGFLVTPPHFHMAVRFETKEDVDALINALATLRDTEGDEFDHVHLQDRACAPGAAPSAAGEVVFHRPGLAPDENERDIIEDSNKWLRKALKKT